jgi:hypothetical protein
MTKTHKAAAAPAPEVQEAAIAPAPAEAPPTAALLCIEHSVAVVVEADVNLDPQVLADYVAQAIGTAHATLHPSDPLTSIVTVEATVGDVISRFEDPGPSRYAPNVTW